MHYWVCVDDTDMPGTKGTGWLVQEICKSLEQKGMGLCSEISRHQLFVHGDIPYTSHNSAMCFEMDLAQDIEVNRLTQVMIQALETQSQKGSDPGLCIAPALGRQACEKLMAFGKKAKAAVCNKDQAYGLARDLNIHLSEHGGTGDGVIGALAGTGLRMAGNDGRYRGWYHLGNPGDIVETAALCDLPFIDSLVTTCGSPVPEKVRIGSEKTKTVRLGFERVVVVTKDPSEDHPGAAYRTITKKEAKQY